MRPSLNARLLVGIGILTALLVGQGVVSALFMDRSRLATGDLASVKIPLLESVHQMDLQIRLQASLVKAYAQEPVPSVKEEILLTRRQYRAALSTYEKLEEKSQVDFVSRITHTWYGQFEPLGQALMDAAEAVRTAKGTDRTEAEGLVTSYRSQLDTSLDEFQRMFDSRVTAPVRFAALRTASGVRDQAVVAVYVGAGSALVALVAGFIVLIVLRRGLARPLGRLSQGLREVAAGRLDLQINDGGIIEFSDAAEGFNTMARQLAQAQRELRHRIAEQGRILDSIPSALLILGTDRKIGSVYSHEAPLVLGTDELSGRSLSEVLFATRPANDETVLLDRYLHQMFENSSVDPEVLAEINPVAQLDYQGPSASAEDQSLEIRFERIIEDDVVNGVLVNIVDRTEARRAEAALASEQTARRRDAHSVEAILNHGPAQLQVFLDETREQLKAIRTGVVSAGGTATLEACFRKLHSIKGTAASLGIEPVAQLAHQAESILAPRRAGAVADTTSNLGFNRVLGAMGEELDSIENLVVRLSELLLRSDRGGEDPKDTLVDSLKSMVAQLSKTLAKELVFEAEVLVDELPSPAELRQILVQLIRNAADHGIEDTYDRLFQGKSTAGTIRVTIGPAPNAPSKVAIEVSDDGAGLDYQAIEAKARALHFLADDAPAPPKSALLRYLFRPGFTTRSEASEISGRGVGLDLVKETIDGLHGTIQVASEPGKGTRFRVLLPA